MEESIPSSIKAGSQRGIPPREVIEYVTQGEIQTSSFKLAKSDDKVGVVYGREGVVYSKMGVVYLLS